MADKDLDELFWVKPDAFVALRTKLSAAAKRRGDQDTARRVSSTNKPTTAAWVVNRLALEHRKVGQRLAHLGDRLRAAHSAMDGDQIRDLSAQQRKLVEELTRNAFQAAELSSPSASIRDDVGATLQAAIANPDVLSALGRLTKPERWSGFGAVDDEAPPLVIGRTGEPKSPPGNRRPRQAADPQRESRLQAARVKQDKRKQALAVAEKAKAEADDGLAERTAELAEARSRLDNARKELRAAERDVGTAEDNYDKARQASRNATDLVREAKARVKRAR